MVPWPSSGSGDAAGPGAGGGRGAGGASRRLDDRRGPDRCGARPQERRHRQPPRTAPVRCQRRHAGRRGRRPCGRHPGRRDGGRRPGPDTSGESGSRTRSSAAPSPRPPDASAAPPVVAASHNVDRPPDRPLDAALAQPSPREGGRVLLLGGRSRSNRGRAGRVPWRQPREGVRRASELGSLYRSHGRWCPDHRFGPPPWGTQEPSCHGETVTASVQRR